MRRFSWLLLVLLLLKLGMGTAVAMQLGGPLGNKSHSAAMPCHDSLGQQQHPAHQPHQPPHAHAHELPHGEADQPPDGHATPPTAVTSETAPSQGAACSDCTWCCAFGLNVFRLSLPQATPVPNPSGLSPRWNSVSLRPGLRPPIA